LGPDKLLGQNRLKKTYGQQADADLLSNTCANQTQWPFPVLQVRGGFAFRSLADDKSARLLGSSSKIMAALFLRWVLRSRSRQFSERFK
jgi:hypothetical protein